MALCEVSPSITRELLQTEPCAGLHHMWPLPDFQLHSEPSAHKSSVSFCSCRIDRLHALLSLVRSESTSTHYQTRTDSSIVVVSGCVGLNKDTQGENGQKSVYHYILYCLFGLILHCVYNVMLTHSFNSYCMQSFQACFTFIMTFCFKGLQSESVHISFS